MLLARLLSLLGIVGTLGLFLPGRFRVFAILASVSVLPGHALLVRTMWGREQSPWMRAAVSIAVTLSFFFVVVLVAERFRLGTDWLHVPLIAITLLAAFVAWLPPRLAVTGGGREERALLVLLAVLASLALARGASVTLATDALDHIAYLKEIVHSGDPFPLTSYYDPSTDTAYDIRKGFFQPVQAAVLVAAGCGAVEGWHAFPAVVLLLSGLVFFALARETLGGALSGMMATVVYLLGFDSGIAGIWFGRACTPFLFAAPLVWGILLVTYRAGRGDKIPIALPLLFGFALMGAHIFAAVVAGLLSALYAFLHVLRWRGRALRSLCSTLGLTAAGMLPLGAWRFATSYPPVDPVHTHLQGVVSVTDSLFFSTPVLAIARLGLFSLLAIPAVVFLCRRLWKEEGVFFAVAITIGPLFLIFNPLIVPVLAKIAGYLVARLAWYGGYALVWGALLGRWFQNRAANGRNTALAKGAGIAALIVFAGTLSLGERQEDWRKLQWMRTAPPVEWNIVTWSDLLLQLDGLPARSRIASDPLTSYMIPAFTSHKVTTLLAQHSSPADPVAPARLQDAVRIFSPFTSASETWDAVKRREADYLVLNFRFHRPVVLFYGGIDPALYGATLAKFRDDPARYEEVGTMDRCHVFRVIKGAASPRLIHDAEQPLPTPQVAAVPEHATTIAPNASPAGIRLLAATIGASAVAPGDTVPLTLYWTRGGEEIGPIPERLYLRIDSREPGAIDRDSPIGKLTRKWRQTREGRLFRARTSRNLVRGSLPAFLWQPEAILADSIALTVPSRMAPGRYTVEALLRPHAHIQVYSGSDFLREEDSFSGITIGELEIRP